MALRTYICGQTSTGGIFLVLAAAAMVTSVPYGTIPRSVRSTGYFKKTCKTPNLTSTPDCGETGVGYIYDNSKRRCELITVFCSNMKGFFPKLVQCVLTCNPKQGAPICAKEPADTCLEPRSVTSRKYTTYSYDISSGECVSRISCGPVRDMEGKNVFLTLSMCEANCWGFDRSNVRGSR
uniref:Pancreatic trypsin inhibitor n=1 Tax=Rhipicephalus zambeziensis TaxID=60191 RepID=A0A224Y2C6_9ACAR